MYLHFIIILFDDDTPTFHVHKTGIGELVKEYKRARGKKNNGSHVELDGEPNEVKRFNSLQKDDVLANEAFHRLADRDKIFSSKAIKDTTHELQDYLFQIQISMSCRASLMTSSNQAGTRNDMENGTNNSSNSLAEDANLELDTLSSKNYEQKSDDY